MLVGYTTGVFDLFHRGHVLLLRRAAALCDRLVVGVSSDEASKYKGKTPVICYEDRAEVVQAVDMLIVLSLSTTMISSRPGRGSILMCCLWVMTGMGQKSGINISRSLMASV